MSGKTAVVLLLIVGALIFGGYLLRAVGCALDASCQAQRAHAAAAAQAQSDALAPLVLWVKRVGLGALIVFLLSLAAGAVAGAISAFALAARARVRSGLVPAEHGLYPAVARTTDEKRRIWSPPAMQLSAPPNEPRAQIVAALTNGIVDRLSSGAMRPILRPTPDEPALLPDLEPAALALPAHASIYTAPLPSELALLLGVGAEHDIALPLRNLGGGVIGGLQGMGKSELMAALMAGLLRQDASGRKLRLGLIDMKGGLDFARIPGNLAAWQWPIATNEAQAVALITQLQAEIKRRTTLMIAAGAANIETYNARRNGSALPYLIVLVDEIMLLTAPALAAGLSRLDRADSREFTRQAQNCLAVGRASGVSLIMATQKPSADVVPTTLRDLAGFRIAFRCATSEASKAILGQGGAEGLPNDPGRALMWRGDRLLPMRAYLAGIETGDFDRFTLRQQRSAYPQLPTDAEADGLGGDDQPDGATEPATATVLPGNEQYAASSRPPVAGSTVAGVPAAHLDAIYQTWLAQNRSLRAVCRAYPEWYSTDNGGPYYVAAGHLNAALRRNGEQRRYRERE